MAWLVRFIEAADKDLKNIGAVNARRAVNAIESKLENGEPDKVGYPLRNVLAGYRKLRVGDIRIIYKVIQERIEVIVVAVGPRRNDEVYKTAEKRLET